MKADPSSIADLVATASLGTPRNALGFVLWRVTHRYQREADRALRPLDLTHLQFVTLVLIGWLGRDGEPITQADVARFGDIHPMQVSNVAKALAAKKLICHETAPSGGPARAVALTEAGMIILRNALPVMAQVQHEVFGAAARPGSDLLTSLTAIDKG